MSEAIEHGARARSDNALDQPRKVGNASDKNIVTQENNGRVIRTVFEYMNIDLVSPKKVSILARKC